jgi:hypothetical protein
MSDLPEEKLSLRWKEAEKTVNADTRPGVVASNPSIAIKKRAKK